MTLRYAISSILAVCLVSTAVDADAMPGGGAGHGDDVWGHPLTTNALPEGTVTVKTAGRDLMDKRPGVMVHLLAVGKDGTSQELKSAKSGADGRARFDGLKVGSRYQVVVDGVGGRKVRSKIFEAPKLKGVRLLLSILPARGQGGGKSAFHGARGHGAASDHGGKAHGSGPGRSGAARLRRAPGLPLTRLRVIVRNAANNQPVGLASLTLTRGTSRKSAKTDAKGKVELDWPAGKGPLVVEVQHGGVGYASEKLVTPKPAETASSAPGKIAAKAKAPASSPATSRPKVAGGLELTFHVFDRTTDLAQLSLGRGTHLLARVGERGVGFLQVFNIVNKSRALVDPGQEGLRLPLPEAAIAPQLGKAAKAFARISKDKRAVLITRPIPPGPLGLRVSYDLMSKRGTLDFRQKLPIAAISTVVAITNSRIPTLGGPGVEKRMPAQGHGGGQQMAFFSLRAVKAGGSLEVTFFDLPHRDSTPKIVVIGGASLILLWGIFAAFAAGRGRRQREAQREALLDELARIDLESRDAPAERGPQRKERRETLLRELEALWG